MIKKILIANRGEIAVRIIRACHELNIQTVAIYSTVDKDALHVQLADEAICVGGHKTASSYLNMNNILSAAINTGVDAIHPGFGFLSENTSFAKKCEETGIKFIGPKAEVITLMGDKAKAREVAESAGVPVVPGSDGILKSYEEAEKLAKKIGFPVLIKAVSGGGGRGMRVADTLDDLKSAYNTAKSEAKVAFGDDSLYMEKFIVGPMHIEIQVIADEHGNVAHLGERDCSMQRRNQKIIEEAPSIKLTEKVRNKMGKVAVDLVKKIGYTNAGTIEFIMDENMNYYFIEMNTRIQVEHPVTEMITGIDLICEQIKIASGEKLSFKQSDIEYNGHSIECRVNAEIPEMNFSPSPGKLNFVHFPGGNGVRVDSGVCQESEISPFYDSMVAKIIVHAKNREDAINKMKRALEEFTVDGVQTNVDFLYELLITEEFQTGKYNTKFVEKYLAKGGE